MNAIGILYYPAIIERGRRGYGVFFPDLPGCTSAGETVTEAINAEEALAGHLLVSDSMATSWRSRASSTPSTSTRT